MSAFYVSVALRVSIALRSQLERPVCSLFAGWRRIPYSRGEGTICLGHGVDGKRGRRRWQG